MWQKKKHKKEKQNLGLCFEILHSWIGDRTVEYAPNKGWVPTATHLQSFSISTCSEENTCLRKIFQT